MAKVTSRRKFLAGASALAAGGALAGAAPAAAASEVAKLSVTAERRQHLRKALLERSLQPGGPGVRSLPEAKLPFSPAPAAVSNTAVSPAGENDMLRMQDELKRAMEKPIDQRQWSMVIDQRKCVGCSACTVACIAENNLPPGVVYRPVLEEEIGEYPRVTRRFTPRPCMHCEEPPCVPVCPVGATYKRPDGIVVINYDRCIGCRYCIVACPYGARSFDFGEHYSDGTPARQPYEESPSMEYGKEWSRGSVEGVTRKCTFCIQRLDAGMLPACVTTCIGHATYFGDGKDPDSLVNELITGGRAVRLKEELGTKPNVHYLV